MFVFSVSSGLMISYIYYLDTNVQLVIRLVILMLTKLHKLAIVFISITVQSAIKITFLVLHLI